MKVDAKLSTKKRKRLPDSAFCGPNRSFPANDCNHVRAGLSLLGRYKGPGSKEKIRACLYRKARKLGCFKSGPGSKKKDSADLSVLFEALYMYNEDTLGFDAVVATIVDVCEEYNIGKSVMNEVLQHIHCRDLDSALSIVLVNVV